jgi:hypothetical protein
MAHVTNRLHRRWQRLRRPFDAQPARYPGAPHRSDLVAEHCHARRGHRPLAEVQVIPRPVLLVARTPLLSIGSDPKRNLCKDLWRLMKAIVAAHRVASSVDDLAQQAAAWLTTLSPGDRLRCSGRLSAKLEWPSTEIML